LLLKSPFKNYPDFFGELCGKGTNATFFLILINCSRAKKKPEVATSGIYQLTKLIENTAGSFSSFNVVVILYYQT
jgi:hypothetical protein